MHKLLVGNGFLLAPVVARPGWSGTYGRKIPFPVIPVKHVPGLNRERETMPFNREINSTLLF
ncbi:hypothetical protein MBAV_001958 [Candidatus Magnetobacterium bavaricum]|uniref:Uncharacterized protein n=1 Tax=Candidatus Magnetobacterium bavaricum TaxID=29290 RepID=A0A0F3GYU3_9BACT|nr:hypothetical protein MBAV_001958 [Candidatus Magnetobacterium bavaricum]